MDLLEQCAKYLERAERYEVMGEVFKLAIPIYEQERDFRVSQLKWLSCNQRHLCPYCDVTGPLICINQNVE